MTHRKRVIELYDTTLRDGSQMKGVSYSAADKLSVVKRLDELGIHFIEGGFAGSNETDADFFEKAKNLELRNASLVVFASTCHKGKKPQDDEKLPLVLETGTEIITLVGKSWKFQVEKVLGAEPEENLRMIRESCAWLKENDRTVFFDAEHFFDGYKENPGYALATLQAAMEGGATRVILCDTNGGTLCFEIGRIIEQVKKEIKVPLGIHCHNDAGMAVANSVEAVRHGAVQVQGTVNGYGERCGNADLCAVISTLQLKMEYECVSSLQLSSLTGISRFVAEIANLAPNPQQPYTGSSAFSHKGGYHVDAQKKYPGSYEHIKPELVGNRGEIVVSELAGRANIKIKAAEFGIELSAEEAEIILKKIKEMGKQGFHFEGADASLELLMRHFKNEQPPILEVLIRRVQSEKKKSKKPKDEAMVCVRVNDKKNNKKKTTYQIAVGSDGPIAALDKAIRKALRPYFGRILQGVKLVDYKVRPVNGAKGIRSSVRVLIEFSNGKNIWATVGKSEDIIEASCQALTDGLEYAILKGTSERQ